MGNPERPLLKTLQAGRGLAAVAVAAFHLSILFGERRISGALAALLNTSAAERLGYSPSTGS